MSVRFTDKPTYKNYELSYEEMNEKKQIFRNIKRNIKKNSRLSNILYKEIVHFDDYIQKRLDGKEKIRYISSFTKNNEFQDRIAYTDKYRNKYVYNMFINEYRKLVAKVEMFNAFGTLLFTKTTYFDSDFDFDFIKLYENEYFAKKFIIITLRDLFESRNIF